MRQVGDESVESVEKGGGPDVDHIHFQVSGEMRSSLCSQTNARFPSRGDIQTDADDDTVIVVAFVLACFRAAAR